MNATLSDQGWRSLSSRQLCQLKMSAGRFYRNELAVQLKHLGYGIRRTGNDVFEIRGIDEATLKNFSTRRKQIETYLAEHNLPRTPQYSELATLKTRKANKDVDREALHQIWRDRLSALDIRNEKLVGNQPSRRLTQRWSFVEHSCLTTRMLLEIAKAGENQ